MAGEIIGYGSDFSYSPTGSTYTSVGNIVTVPHPEIDTNDVDITKVSSPSRFREFMAGLSDAGELEVEVIFLKANMAAIYALIQVTQFWKVTFSDLATTASTWVCQGYLKGISGEIPLDDKVMAKFKVKLTGKPVFTAGT